MGDRGNIIVRQAANTNTDDVWFYSHWGGSDLPAVLQKALARKQRWDDPSYLARIIFSEMIKGHVEGETGFGISCSIQDNSHNFLVVDVPAQEVSVVDSSPSEAEGSDGRLPKKFKPIATWSFDDYATLKELPQI